MPRLNRLLPLWLLTAAISVPSLLSQTLVWQPDALKQGSPVFFTIELDKPVESLTGRWLDKDVTFFPSLDRLVWQGLAGADVETRPGDYAITITDGHGLRVSRQVTIGSAHFHTTTLTVPGAFVDLSPEAKEQIARETALKSRLFAQSATQPLWSGRFTSPVNVLSRNFGESRVFNGHLESIHRGADFPVGSGTPIHLSNSGTVMLAQKLFNEGNCVIVDHGGNLFTIYMHLSRIDVMPGERLKRGAVIGLSGATGRVTGPHLHMAVRWNGLWLSPMELMALNLPGVETDGAAPMSAPQPGSQPKSKARSKSKSKSRSTSKSKSKVKTKTKPASKT